VGGRGTAMKNRMTAGAAEASAMPRTVCMQTIECKDECECAEDGRVEWENGKPEPAENNTAE